MRKITNILLFDAFKVQENIKENIGGQAFDLDTWKPELLKYIIKVKKGDKPQGRSLFYDILTNPLNKRIDRDLWKNKGNELIEIENKWKEKFEAGVKKNILTAWSSWVGNQTRISDEDGDKTYNRYFTLLKKPDNIRKFIDSIIELHKNLKELSVREKKSILWKTKLEFADMINHNDTLKVYWFDNSIREKINNVIENWINKNKIEMSKRSHEYGIDYGTMGSSGKSFGQILGYLLEYPIVGIIMKNKNKTDEELFEYIKNNFDRFISDIKRMRKEGRISDIKLKNYIDNYPESLYNRGFF